MAALALGVGIVLTRVGGLGRDAEEGIKAFMEKRPARFTGTLARDAPQVYPWWTPIDTEGRQEAGGPPPGKSRL